jgi:hypothetical protein
LYPVRERRILGAEASVGTRTEHRDAVEAAATRWLKAASAYAAASYGPSPDGVPSVRQQQATEAERMTRALYERALAAYRRHLRGESHDE